MPCRVNLGLISNICLKCRFSPKGVKFCTPDIHVDLSMLAPGIYFEP